MEANKVYITRKQYLNENPYQMVANNHETMSQKYQQLCEILQRYFSNFQNPKLSQQHLLEFNKPERYIFLKQLKLFVEDITNIIQDISCFQIECLDSLKSNIYYENQWVEEMLLKVKDLQALQNTCISKRQQLNLSIVDLRNSFHLFKKDIASPQMFYDQKYTIQAAKTLNMKIKWSDKLIKQILSKRPQILQKQQKFDPILSKYRKKLLKDKYNMHKKVYELSTNVRYCLVQMFSMINECFRSKKQQFLKQIHNQQDDIVTLKDMISKKVKKFSENSLDVSAHSQQHENNIWERLISTTMQEYNQVVDEIEAMFRFTCAWYSSLGEKMKKQNQKYLKLINTFNSFYDKDESPAAEMIKTKELFDFILNIQVKCCNDISFIEKKINMIKIDCRKHSQIVLSLLKVKKHSNQSQLFSFGKGNNQLTQLIEEISFGGVKDAIVQYFDIEIKNIAEILTFFNSHSRPYSKSLTKDSMEISHTNPAKYSFPLKKPFKNQLWLWKEIKVEIQLTFNTYLELFDEILAVTKTIEDGSLIKQNNLLEQHECLLHYNDQKKLGILKINAQSLQFQNEQKNMIIIWKDIESIEIRSKYITKFIVIKTFLGEIMFSNIENIENILQSLKEAQEKSQLGGGSLTKKQKIQLSEKQLEFIQSRKEKIANQLIKLDGFEEIISVVFQNQEIDQIYDLFYSDKTFNFYGKEQFCFATFVTKKGGNYDILPEKYNTPGPKFYSLDENVTFQNCPLFSSRKLVYNHTLPYMPFMPSFCVNHDQRKIYWISNEELDYYILNQTSGIAMADNFYVEVLQKIRKVGSNVELKIYKKIVFVKETSFKGMIISKTDPELLKNMKEVVSEMQKIINFRKTAGTKGELPKMIAGQDDSSNPKQLMTGGGDEINKLKLHNRILLGGLVILIIVNLISKLF